MNARSRVPRPFGAGLRGRRWSAPERAALVSAIAIAMAALFVTTYSLALGNPVPHGVPIAVVGDQATHAATVQAVSRAAGDPEFRTYDSLAAAQDAVDWQPVYAALDLTAEPTTMYVASAAGASVARAQPRFHHRSGRARRRCAPARRERPERR